MTATPPTTPPDPDDNPDATRIMRPRPSARSPAQQSPPPQPPPSLPIASEPPPAPPPQAAAAGSSLLPAATPLLQLLSRIRTLPRADPAALLSHAGTALAAFERAAAGYDAPTVRRASYALADSIDAAVAETPWGAGAPSLVASHHPTIGAGRTLAAATAAAARPDTPAALRELLFLCLTVGSFPDRAGAEAARAALLATLPAPPAEPLSPRWRGEDAPFRTRRIRVPLWVAAAIGLLAVGGAYVFVLDRTNAAGDAAFARMLAAPPTAMPDLARPKAPPPPPPPPPPEPGIADRIGPRLAAIDGAIVLAGTPGRPIVIVPERLLFAADGAALSPGAGPVLAAVAEAVRSEAPAARLLVLAFTDDKPVRTVRFPSAFRLSAARAETVRAALARLLPGATLAADGRGAAEPLAPNDGAANRERNRRVEIRLDADGPAPGSASR